MTLLFQIKELKRSLHTQAEGVLTLAGHVQQLYAAYMQLLDLMPDTPPSSKEAGSLSDSTGMSKIHNENIIKRIFLVCFSMCVVC